MSKEQRAQRRIDGSFLGLCSLVGTALLCTGVILTSPRPVEPGDLPALSLNASQAARQLTQDAELAARAPRSDAAARLLALYREAGIDELAPHADGSRVTKRRAELAMLSAEIADRSGREALAALRAVALREAMRALRGDLEVREAQGWLGAFAQHLAQNGFVARDGALRAPELAVRALYKARFNLVLQQSREAGLSSIERQALDGYIALHAHAVSASERVRAARDFYDAEGQHAAEAFGTWLFASGAGRAASTLLEREYAATRALRVRNMLLFVHRHP